jgi:hydroxyacylglutathione hydrolase
VGPAIVFDTAESKNKGCFIIAQRTYLAKRDLLVEIKTLTFGGVNCYLLSIHSGFLLIDTGFSKNRVDVEKGLESAGCKPGSLRLIVLTHGDFDHSGNAAYLRGKYGVEVAMHRLDEGMVEHGDLFYNRNANFFMRVMGKLLLFFLRGGLKKSDRFTPDMYVDEGEGLSDFGFDAKVIHIPGHSAGSIGVLTDAGDLFCGDLLENTKEPAKNSLIADKKAFETSVERLKQLIIGMVYPGHGEPFQMELFMKSQAQSGE